MPIRTYPEEYFQNQNNYKKIALLIFGGILIGATIAIIGVLVGMKKCR